jgi:hypothetical protein
MRRLFQSNNINTSASSHGSITTSHTYDDSFIEISDDAAMKNDYDYIKGG